MVSTSSPSANGLGHGRRLLAYNLAQHGVAANASHHLAATMQSQVLSLYLDGVRVAERSATVAGGNARPVMIGRDGTDGFFWRGKLDDGRLWNVARSPEQIQAAFGRQLDGPIRGSWPTGGLTRRAEPSARQRWHPKRESIRLSHIFAGCAGDWRGDANRNAHGHGNSNRLTHGYADANSDSD